MRGFRPIQRGFVVVTGLALGGSAFAVTGITDSERPAVTPPPAPTTAVTRPVHEPPPATTPPEPESPGPIVIHATGDVLFDPTYVPQFAVGGYEIAFDGVDGLFVSDDLTIVNLECTPSALGVPADKEFVFRCPVPSLAVAQRFGIDVVNLANNHSRDHGETAMLDGKLQAILAGLDPVGVGGDAEAAYRPALFERSGHTIAVLGMGGVVPASAWVASADSPGMASGDDIAQMTAAVSRAAGVADLVFVTIHWGVEGEREPRADDRERAEALIAAGADAIFGHHPHRLGALEWVDGAPVFWTLGNFIWPRQTDESSVTGVARLEIDPSAEVVTACILPAFIEVGGQPALTGPSTCDGRS